MKNTLRKRGGKKTVKRVKTSKTAKRNLGKRKTMRKMKKRGGMRSSRNSAPIYTSPDSQSDDGYSQSTASQSQGSVFGSQDSQPPAWQTAEDELDRALIDRAIAAKQAKQAIRDFKLRGTDYDTAKLKVDEANELNPENSNPDWNWKNDTLIVGHSELQDSMGGQWYGRKSTPQWVLEPTPEATQIPAWAMSGLDEPGDATAILAAYNA